MRKVVVVGGGFGGVTVARELERLLTPRFVDITLVSAENSMLFTPLLSLVAGGVLDARQAMIPLRPQLSRSNLVLGSATAVDLNDRTLAVVSRSGEVESLPWDRLVLAPGSVTRVPPSIPGVESRAFGVKTLNEAAALRNHVLEQLELANATSDRWERIRRTTFVVVGGGFAGTEMTAQLQSMTQDAIVNYPQLQVEGTRWLLLQHGARILPEMTDTLSERATKVLRRRGVEVRTETTVGAAGAGWVELTDGEKVATETLIWSAGVAPHPWLADLELPADDHGRLEVTDWLNINGYPDIYAVGDAAAVTDRFAPVPMAPPTAGHAASQGRTCAHNIAASFGTGQPRPHRHPKDRTQVVNLGSREAIGQVVGIPVSGIAGWAATVLNRVAQLPRERRTRIALDWWLHEGGKTDIAELGQIGASDPRAAAEPELATRRQTHQHSTDDKQPVLDQTLI